jgi:hypothetical protein
MRTLAIYLTSVLLALGPAIAAGADLYSGEVVVAGKEAAERRQALPATLAHVLQKLSGLRHFDEHPLVEPSLQNASSMLVSFHYRSVERVQADGSPVEELKLVARYDSNRIDELTRSLQLPLWPPERAPLEIWVVIDDSLGRRIFPVEFAYAWESMSEVAEARGLGVEWPLPDETGVFAVDTQLLWGGYTEEIYREPGHGVLIAAARREGLEWSVRLNLEHGEQVRAWRLQDIDLQAALQEAMHQAVDLIAADDVIAASDLGHWVHEITVTGIAGPEDYRRVLAFLQQVSVARRVSVLSAAAGQVTFRAELSALPRYLLESLEAAAMFEFDPEAEAYVLLP